MQKVTQRLLLIEVECDVDFVTKKKKECDVDLVEFDKNRKK